MDNDVFITCAVTGSGPSEKVHPHLPITPKEIAESAIEAAKAGAAIVHLHARDPETGTGMGASGLDTALFREMVGRIRESDTDVIINLSTGIGGDYVPGESDPNIADARSFYVVPERRMEHVMELKPEICSLDVATMQFGDNPYINTPTHLKIMAKLAKEANVKPEIEVFDSGHIRLANQLLHDQFIDAPPLFQLCLGVKWGAPDTADAMSFMQRQLPDDAVWSGFGLKHRQMAMAAQAVILGGNIRVGLEDNLYLEKGVFATNAQLVARAVTIANCLGANVLSAQQIRTKLALQRHHG